jgi:hypothetical protein
MRSISGRFILLPLPRPFDNLSAGNAKMLQTAKRGDLILHTNRGDLPGDSKSE